MMIPKREYPDQPLVGVGGVVVDDGRVLLIRRGGPPLAGEWSIPGGLVELGETLAQGVVRELAEETGLEVAVLGLIDVFERIEPAREDASAANRAGPRYHYVVLDYLCAVRGGSARAGSDASELAWAREDELAKFDLTPNAIRVLQKAFAMARERAK